MTFLDYFSGSHGMFLEYVINSWIFDGPRVANPFTDLGTSHRIYFDAAYQNNKQITANHWTEFDQSIDRLDKMVCISINSFKGQCCYQINVDIRAGDLLVIRKPSVPADILASPRLLRNDFYAKFVDSSDGYGLPGKWKYSHVDSFYFRMESLYDMIDFYAELRQLASFLDRVFRPDQDLVTVWNKFIEKNHGLVMWNKCHNILKQSLSGYHADIDLDTREQSLLNAMITRCIGLADGDLFEYDQYPGNTTMIRNQIEHYLKTFHQRFVPTQEVS